LQLSNAEVELAALQEQYRTSQRQVAQLRSDVDKISQVEIDLKQLNRDYGVVESRHQELLRRWETLKSKQRLDPVTDKVQFNILEPPFAPARPVAPNRPIMLITALIFCHSYRRTPRIGECEYDHVTGRYGRSKANGGRLGWCNSEPLPRCHSCRYF